MSTSARDRTRPRDRKRHIEEAAALAFSERGYHQVSMTALAAAVGISGPALYRHFPNKYALFLQSAFRVAHRLIENTEDVAALPVETGDDAVEQLELLINAVISTTIELRAVGGIYRWEGRYLEAEDRHRLTDEFTTLRARFTRRLSVLRDDASAEDVDVAVWTALSAVASVTAHRTVVAASSLEALLRDTAWRALLAPIPGADEEPSRPAAVASAPSRRRERLVAEAIGLFAARGYHDVTIEEIASAVELTASGVYRHFEGKAAILLEACERAATRLEEGTERARATAATDGAHAALRELAADYVARTDENHRLMRVYFADVSSLDPDDQRRLRALQRNYISQWTDLLIQARPSLSAREATVLVHAGFSVVADLLTRAHMRKQSATTQTIRMLEVVLGLE